MRYHHFGEAAHEDTERRIRALLGETVTARTISVDPDLPLQIRTPESYLGYERLTRFANGSLAPDVESTYTLPPGAARAPLLPGRRRYAFTFG